ncbi:MarR family transcriptional regulator [Deinococcus sp. YIM 134068]|uniref:MarR family winged helix-turn-helix transcriptional regulator n=1 Tax=Deinococcus lichenicola TaxID=3118910 RepID=UPI002F95182C
MSPAQTPDLLERIHQDWTQTRPEVDPGPMLTVLLLDRLHAALTRQIERTYAETGLNPAGWDLLLTLYRSAPPEGLTPTELSGLAAITGPSMTNRVDRLLSRGLVERRVSESDRRSVRVRLTPEGRSLVERLLPEHLANAERILSALDPAETRTLERLARRLLTGLEASGQPSPEEDAASASVRTR